jgi:hypothetical protein
MVAELLVVVGVVLVVVVLVGVLVVVLLVVVLDGVLVVVVVDLDVLVVLELVLVDELVVVAAAGQFFAVNEEIMLASWLRLDWSVPLTDEGRFATEVLNACDAFAAAPHCPAAIAAEIASSCLFKVLA